MERWVQLDTKVLDKPKVKDLNGIRVAVSLSPYDIPSAVRGFRDPQSKWFVIEFRYLTEEAKSEPIGDERVKIVNGLKSQRIYQIHVNVEALQANEVSLGVKINDESNPRLRNLPAAFIQALDNYKGVVPIDLQNRRRNLAKSVINSHQEALFKVD